MEENASKFNHRIAPHIALILTQIMFGAGSVLGKFALLQFPPSAIVGFRVAGAAAVFYFLQRFQGTLRLDKRKHYFYFAVFSLIGISINQLLFFKGLSLTTAVNTSLLAITIPIFAIVISAVIGFDKLNLSKIAGVILAALGVIFLIDPQRASFTSETTQGNLLIVLNSLFYASYVALSKKLIQQYGALKSIAWLFLFGSLINIPIGIYSMSSVNLSEITLNSWLFLAALVIFPTILAYYFNAWALVRVSPAIVAVYIYLQPLIGFTTAVIFLGETFNFRFVIAAAMIFTGLFLVTLQSKDKIIHTTS